MRRSFRSSPNPAPDGPIVEIQFGSIAPDYRLSLFGDTSMISGLEITAVCGATFSLRGRFAGGGGIRLYLSIVIMRFFVRVRGPTPLPRSMTIFISALWRAVSFPIYEFGQEESIVSGIRPIRPLAVRLLDFSRFGTCHISARRSLVYVSAQFAPPRFP